LKIVIIISLLLVGCICANGQDYGKIDSLKLELLQNPANRFDILFGLFLNYRNSKTDSALYFADLASRDALNRGDSLSIVRSFHARGDMKIQRGDLSKGIGDLEIALEIAKRNGFDNRTKYILNILALAHTVIANYDKALDYNFQSLKIREEAGDPMDISVAQNNIGLVYLSISDYENALDFFEKSLRTKSQANISHDVERCYINIGLSAKGLGQYQTAIDNLKKAFEICGKDCDQTILMEAHNALGEAYRDLKDWKNAKIEFERTIEIARELSSFRYESMALNSIARIQLENKELDQALEFVQRSQQLVTNSNLKDQNLNDFAMLTEIYRQLGDFETASKYQQMYIDLNKEIFNSNLIRNISRIQSDYEERENLKTIAAKDQVLNLQEDIIARQKAQDAFIITITILVLGLAFVMFRANQSQRKTNQALAVAKETIQQQNEMLSNANHQLESEVQERTKELVESNESLIKVNDEMDNFIYKTSHDIRGPLASLKGICNVAMLDVKDKTALDYLNKLDTSAAKLNAILSRLLIINQINHSLLNPEPVDFEEQVEEILELERKKGLPPRMDISYQIEPKLNLRSDKEMTKIVLENLIDNAIKFHNESARVNPFVKIDFTRDQDWITVKVIDNGIGINESSREKIFQLFVRASERSDSGGIGLYLSKLATIKLGGTIDLTTTEEGYTAFRVRFPPDLMPIIEQRTVEQLKREKQKQKVLKVS